MWLVLTQGAPPLTGIKTIWQGMVKLSVVGPHELPWTHAVVCDIPETELKGLPVPFEAYPVKINTAVNFVRPLMHAGGLLRGFFEPGALSFEKLKEHELAHEMPGEAAVNPDDAQIRSVLASEHRSSVFMINLLQYRKQASYPANSPFAAQPISGKEAYRKYGRVALRSVALLGGEAMIAGDLGAPVRNTEFSATFGSWDELAIVRYPEPQSLLKLVFMPGYTEATVHRTAALADTRLILTTPV